MRFFASGFFMNQIPHSPRVFHEDHFDFFRKFADLFAFQGAPPVSTTQAANFSTSFASFVDTGGIFATGVNDIGGKFATGVNASLELRISPRIFEKIRNGPNCIISGVGESDS
jgi:hypothetical protein